MDEQWAARASQMTLELSELRSFATALPKAKRMAVDAAAANFIVKWMAGLMRLQVSGHLRAEELVIMFELMVNLNLASGRALDRDEKFLAQLVWYAQNGLDAPAPDA